jgi:LacI family transcriptional regulator
MRVSLRTIAREVGLDVSTVSRALRGLSLVNEETRNHIREVADRLGYVRDPLLSNALTFARKADKPIYRETLAFLAAIPSEQYREYPWLTKIYEGATLRAQELGYGLQPFRIPAESRRQQTLGRQLHARGMRGCIVCSGNPAIQRTSLSVDMDWDQLTGVEVGHELASPELPRIVRGLCDDVTMIMPLLHSRGYRKVGLVVLRLEEEMRGWSLMAAGMVFAKFNRDTKFSSLFDTEKTYTQAAFSRWFRKFQPDALVVNGPGVGEWAAAEGIRVPDELGIFRIDCTEERHESGLLVDYERIGTMAVNHLSSLLERKSIDSSNTSAQTPASSRLTISIPSLWHEGQTLHPAS